MKYHQFTLTLASTLLIFAAGVACTSKADRIDLDKTAQTDDITSTDVLFSIKKVSRNYITEGTEALFDDSTRIYSTVSARIQWPVKIGDYDISVLQDSLQALALGTTKGTIDQAIESSMTHPIGQDTYTLTPIDSIPSTTDGMILYQNINADVKSFNDNYITFCVTHSVYEGGAHGMTASSYLTWLNNAGHTLTLAKAFKPGYEQTLLEAIKTGLLNQNRATNMKELERYGYYPSHIYISPNFYIDRYSLVFHYNPYEIASYATGSTDVRIPYPAVADILSPELLQIFETQ